MMINSFTKLHFMSRVRKLDEKNPELESQTNHSKNCLRIRESLGAIFL